MADDPAVLNLKLAYSYLERVKERDRTRVERNQALNFASKHLADVALLDPHASFTIEDKKETKTFTLDSLAAYALYLERFENPDNAENILLHAVSITPHNPYILTELAEYYLTHGEREKGFEVLTRALEVDPAYLPAVDLRNKLQDNPYIARPVPNALNNLSTFLYQCGMVILYPISILLFIASIGAFLNLDHQFSRSDATTFGIVYLAIAVPSFYLARHFRARAKYSSQFRRKL
jgi:tetratricopeptide (TPR) repeat protein